MRIFIAGGAGFIGANFAHLAVQRGHQVLVYDSLTYAGNRKNLAGLSAEHCKFVLGDICDRTLVESVLSAGLDGTGFDIVINFAAESHVDRSIITSIPFVRSNVLGAVTLIEAAREVGIKTFLQISTDEVYGSAPLGKSFKTDAPLRPSSGYSASKIAADHLLLSYHITHGYDVRITRCTNNYGRFQYPEKLIPTIITSAIRGNRIPVFGDGSQIRDWLHVDDHCEGIMAVAYRGKPGEIYHFGSDAPDTQNITLVHRILDHLAAKTGVEVRKLRELIKHVPDRPGGDRRYSLDWTMTQREIAWEPKRNLYNGLSTTVDWYLRNPRWWDMSE